MYFDYLDKHVPTYLYPIVILEHIAIYSIHKNYVGLRCSQCMKEVQYHSQLKAFQDQATKHPSAFKLTLWQR